MGAKKGWTYGNGMSSNCNGLKCMNISMGEKIEINGFKTEYSFIGENPYEAGTKMRRLQSFQRE